MGVDQKHEFVGLRHPESNRILKFMSWGRRLPASLGGCAVHLNDPKYQPSLGREVRRFRRSRRWPLPSASNIGSQIWVVAPKMDVLFNLTWDDGTQ